MRIKYSPQISEKIISYQFENETITATCGELTNTYDLSQLTDTFYKDTVNENGEIQSEVFIKETIFEFCPIINAFRDNMLNVELINFISADAPESEKYPDWIIIN